MMLQKTTIFLVLMSSFLCLHAQSNNEQLAIQYYQNQEYDKAVDLFKELYQKRPDAYYYTYYFETLLALKEYRVAERLVNKQIKIYPLIQKYKVDLGQVFTLEGENNKAKKHYESCISQSSHTSLSIKELAIAFQTYQLNDYAIQTYLQGRKISGNSGDYAIELGVLYAAGTAYQKAMDEFLSLLATSPDQINMIENILINWLIDDPQKEKRNIIQSNILKYANKNPDVQVYSTLLLWFAMQEKDFSFALKQAKAFDKRYREDGRTVYEIAAIASENMDFQTAMDGYNYILHDKGKDSPFYELAKVASLHATYLKITHTYPKNQEEIQNLDNRLQAFFSEYPLHVNNISIFREWAQIKSIYANDIQTAKAMLEDAVYKQRIPPKEKAILKIDLGDILRLDGNEWDATLLYSQVEKDFPNDTIGHYAKYKNAKLSFFLGEFDWAEAQLNVLRAATSKLIANDAMYLSMLIFDNQNEDSINPALMYYAKADFMLESNRLTEADLYLDSIHLVALFHSLSDDILFKKAEIAIKRQDYQRADSLLNILTQNYRYELLADDALFLRANLHDLYFKDAFTAMELYQQLMKDYPSSIFVVDARKRFRILRGDVLQQVN